MSLSEVHVCQCNRCQQETSHPDQELHRQMNLLLSRLDEQQRRWYVAVEANRIGPGGNRLLSQITGLDEKTIQRGRKNWPILWQHDQPNRFASPVGDANAQKKRHRARVGAPEAGHSRDRRGPHERAEVGAQQPPSVESAPERPRS